MKSLLPPLCFHLGKLTYLIAAGAIAAMCLLTLLDTGSRALGLGSVPIVFDLNETLIVVVAFIPLAFAQLTGDHVSFTVLYDRTPPKIKRAFRMTGYALALPLIAWMTWVTADSAIASWQALETRMGVARLPVWPARLAAALGLLGYVAVLIYGITASIREWNEFPLQKFAHGDDEQEVGL